MRSLDPALRELFAPFVAHTSGTGIFSDLDGTLSQIVAKPDEARPLPEAPGVLKALAVRYERVAIISGRPLSYLQQWFAAPIVLSGLYGLEGERDGAPYVHPLVAPWRTVIDDVTARASDELPEGVVVEHKGLALTLHYRQQPGAREVIETWAAGIAATTGLRSEASRMSVELNPPLDVDKGAVLTELAEGLERVCYFGDDRGDIPAFDALQALRDRGVTTASVAVVGSETPPEVVARADVSVEGPEHALAALRALLPE